MIQFLFSIWWLRLHLQTWDLYSNWRNPPANWSGNCWGQARLDLARLYYRFGSIILPIHILFLYYLKFKVFDYPYPNICVFLHKSFTLVEYLNIMMVGGLKINKQVNQTIYCAGISCVWLWQLFRKKISVGLVFALSCCKSSIRYEMSHLLEI